MTLKELYSSIDGDFEQAQKVLRVEKLIDKHIRKFAKNGVIENVIKAAEGLDPTAMFETAHAMKGVCANLGLVKLAQIASDLSEEFRPGNARQMTDEQVGDMVREIGAIYRKTADGIARYENSLM
ncbi:MAG: Hpt domain-containing protein [Clostridia bacterium]|nr:Hpt domain-containing protein [Clostridia bacterium]